MATHPEGAFRPRQNNKEAFIPIDEVSTEDIHPDFDWTMARSPEDQDDERRKAEQAEWEEEAWYAMIDRQLALMDEEDYYPEVERDEDKPYWDRVSDMGAEYATLHERGETFENFLEKYDLPSRATQKDIERIIARERKHRAARSNHDNENIRDRRRSLGHSDGKRGAEPVDKHQKGGESIRGLHATDTDATLH